MVIIWGALRWVQYVIELSCSLFGVMTLGFYRPWWDFSYICWLSKLRVSYEMKQRKGTQ